MHNLLDNAGTFEKNKFKKFNFDIILLVKKIDLR